MPQTKLAPGKTGAKVTSFDENAARAFVKRVMDEYPLAGRDEIVRRVREQVTGRSQKYLPSFVDYATINAWRVIREGEKAAASDRRGEESTKSAGEVETERRQAEAARTHEQNAAKAQVKIALLDLLAPNGKLWRDLTIEEYMAFGKKQYEHGARMLKSGHKKSELLGSATTDAEIQKVYK